MKRLIIYLTLISLLTTCKKETEQPVPVKNWQSYGLETLQIENIKISDNFIYAATNDGIYRNEINNLSTSGWKRIGLESKDVLDFLVFNEQEILAAIEFGEDENISLYKTTDGGTNWIPFQRGFGGNEHETVRAFELDPENKDRIYARGNYVVARSVDRGENWETLYGEWGMAGYQAPLIKIDPIHPDYVWAGGENSIFQPYLFKSTNKGDTWDVTNIPYEGDNAVYSLVSHPDNPERVLVGMEGQILNSTDGGESWETSITFEGGSYIISLEKHPIQLETIFASGSQGGTSGGNLFFYESDDFGQNWELQEYNEDNGPVFINDLSVQVHNKELVLFFATNKGIYSYTRSITSS